MSESAAAIGRVHGETWQATYAGLLPDAMLVAMSDVRQSAWWSQVLRLLAEERLLSQDEAYRAFKERVRFRLIPRVF